MQIEAILQSIINEIIRINKPLMELNHLSLRTLLW